MSEAIIGLPIDSMPAEFWRVYNYVARQWYETEHGKVEPRDRWYHPAMMRLEQFAQHEGK